MKKIGLIALSFVFGVFSSARADDSVPQKSDWNVRDHVPLKKFIVQSHRGAGDAAPENTVEAFELGWKWGAYPEGDIRTTKDGVIVTFHDGNFARVVKGASDELKKKGVKDLTWDELSKLDVGSWKGDQFSGRRVSKLSEAFEHMTGRPERHMYLDIKNVDFKQLADLVKAHHVEKQVILATPKYAVIKEWKSLVPDGQTLLWMGGTEADKAKTFKMLRKENFAGVTQIQEHVRRNTNSASADPFTPSNKFMIETGKEVRSHGILFQVLPWDISDPKTYWQLLDLGVESFATDYPDVVLQAVRDYYKQKPDAKIR